MGKLIVLRDQAADTAATTTTEVHSQTSPLDREADTQPTITAQAARERSGLAPEADTRSTGNDAQLATATDAYKGWLRCIRQKSKV